jgi:hypothetical protein
MDLKQKINIVERLIAATEDDVAQYGGDPSKDEDLIDGKKLLKELYKQIDLKEILKKAFDAGYDNSVMHNNFGEETYFDFDEFYREEIEPIKNPSSN